MQSVSPPFSPSPTPIQPIVVKEYYCGTDLKKKNHEIKLFSCNGNKKLANDVASYLNIPIRKCKIDKFSNGEIQVEIKEHVRGCDAYIIQQTGASTQYIDRHGNLIWNSVNDNLMELHIIADALRGSSASFITAVIPCFGYSRQDKKDRSRAAITAKCIAKHLESDGISHIITVDLHASQIQGFFNIPVDNLYAEKYLIRRMQQMMRSDPRCIGKRVPTYIVSQEHDLSEDSPNTLNRDEIEYYQDICENPQLKDYYVVVSPDAGGSKRAIRIAHLLGVEYAIISKNRKGPSVIESMDLMGNVTDKTAFVVDDLVDTCGTLVMASEVLHRAGCTAVHCFATHGLLSGPAIDRINKSPFINSLVVSDTVSQEEHMDKCPKLQCISLAALLGEAIARVHTESSISELFKFTFEEKNN